MLFDEFITGNIKISYVTLCNKDEQINGRKDHSTDCGRDTIFFKYPGDNTFIYNDVSTHLTNATVGFLPYHRPYTSFIVDAKIPSPSINISLKGDRLNFDDAKYFDCQSTPRMKILFESMLSTWEKKELGYEAKATSYLFEIIHLLQKHHTVPDASHHKYDVIFRSLDYIAANYMNQDFDYEYLAKLSQVSYSYYHRLFTAKYDITPKQYVNNLKLSTACDLLKSSQYSISEIADILGYSSIYYFSHAFTKNFGLSPRDYKKKYSDLTKLLSTDKHPPNSTHKKASP